MTVGEMVSILQSLPPNNLLLSAHAGGGYAAPVVSSWSKETLDVTIIIPSNAGAVVSGQMLEEGWRPK